MGKLQINGDLTLTDTSSSRIPTLTFVRGTNSDTYTDWRIQANGGNLYFQHTFNGADWTTSMQFNEETQGGTISTPYSISATGGFIGNASSASKLATARTISLTGSVTGSGSFDGSGNLNITTTTNHGHNYLPLSGGTVSGRVTFSAQDNTTNPAGQTIFLDGVSGSTDIAKAPGIGFHIGQINWGSLKFISDGSFRFYNSGCNGYMPVYASTFFGDLSGNAATATKLKNTRTISLTGSVTGSGTFDGSGNLSIATTTNHSHNYLPLSGGRISGDLRVNTNSGTNGFFIERVGSDGEYTKIFQDDQSLYFNMYNDETNCNIYFNMSASDTETGGGAGANSGTVSFHLRNGKTTVGANYFDGTAGYANSAGAVAWNNITGKPSTFTPSSHTHSYLPLSGGAMTKNTWQNYSSPSDATIHFGNFTNAQPNGTYYRPWLAGMIAHSAVGYGNTVVLGQFSDHYAKVGFYIGHSWDGKNSDTFHKFYRDGHFYTPRPVTSNYGSSFPSDPHTGEIFYKT